MRGLAGVRLVLSIAVSAGGDTDVVEQREDGSERTTKRRRDADIGVLVVAINRLLAGDRESLDERRDRAVFELTAEKLALAEARYREQRSDQILRSSTRKAVIGALAAVPLCRLIHRKNCCAAEQKAPEQETV